MLANITPSVDVFTWTTSHVQLDCLPPLISSLRVTHTVLKDQYAARICNMPELLRLAPPRDIVAAFQKLC